MFAALCVGVAFTLRSHTGPVRLAVMRRATLPRRIFSSASGRADWTMALFNSTTSVLYFGSVLIPIAVISDPVSRALEQLIARPHFVPNGPVMAVAATIAFYLSYEFAYWLDHYLMHRFEVLWRFHSVHHTAESLSPLTNYRVHPVDSIIAYNILAISNGITGGLLLFAFGGAASPYLIYGTNALILVLVGVVGTLQHSHFWIVFPKPLDRLLLSPAHHQLHHSVDPAHHNSNYGSTLAIFDWLFGTLTVPPRRRPKLSFGVEGVVEPHRAEAMLLRPFAEAAAVLKRSSDRKPTVAADAEMAQVI
jgi:sterol desaturase/sphingolipid hydroxylase (fatty acid hydroxylase superfamily)